MNKLNSDRKPFPWKCSTCNAKSVVEQVVTHECDLEFDGRTYHLEINDLITPKCSACGAVHLDDEANKAITSVFLAQAKLLTPMQIKANREWLDLTQKQLASALGVADAAVIRWEDGLQFQQRSLDNLMRLFFGIAPVREILIAGTIAELGEGAHSPPYSALAPAETL